MLSIVIIFKTCAIMFFLTTMISHISRNWVISVQASLAQLEPFQYKAAERR